MGKFAYAPGNLSTITGCLSTPRLAPYRNLTTSDQEAVDLYVWNEMLAAAFVGPLRIFEVVLRNALHRELQAGFATDWANDGGFRAYAHSVTTKDLLRDLDVVRAKINARRKAVTADIDDVVAGMDFGYWTTMLDNNFEPGLWAPMLHKAFPHFKAVTGRPLTRPPVADRLNRVRLLRNKISHSEPLIKRTDLLGDYEEILEATSWITPSINDWIDHHARVRELVSMRDRPKYLF